MKISNILLGIIAVVLLLNAYILYSWVDTYMVANKYTYIGSETLRVNNRTDEVQAYNPEQHTWHIVER